MAISSRRLAIAIVGAAGALLLAFAAYLAFADLGRYKTRIEALVAHRLGRTFAVEGAFELRLLPSVELLAERVRVGNAAWGSTPQMIEIGRLSASIGPWSLISGPVDFRRLEVRDVTATLERRPDGVGNWTFGVSGGTGAGGTLPVVVRKGSLHDMRVDYREAGKAGHVALVQALSMAVSPAGTLAVSGQGKFDDVPVSLSGDLGPLDSLLAGRDMRVSANAAAGDVKFDLHGKLGQEGSDLHVAFSAPSLARLHEGLPPIPVTLAAHFAATAGALELNDLKGRLGESDLSGRALFSRTAKRRIELELASPRLDLNPFLDDRRDEPSEANSSPRRFLFDESPLPLDALKGIDLRSHFAVAELRLLAGWLKDVDATLAVEDGRLTFKGRAKGGVQGTLESSLTLSPAAGAGADLSVGISAKDLRAGFEAGRQVAPDQVPPTSVELRLKASGDTPRQMAAGASGRFVLTQAPGEIETGLVSALGGDVLAELAGKLNPFASKDAFSVLDCTVVRADVVAGEVTVKPFLFQTRKVAVVADGRIDLRTEALALGFSTQPRQGLGISAGMFTNPFIELGGSLASPKLGVGAKGAASGAAALATGGMSVIAQGLLDRLRGTQDQCPSALAEAAADR